MKSLTWQERLENPEMVANLNTLQAFAKLVAAR
jgi:hypothetical protein